jgi:hypothetical protein
VVHETPNEGRVPSLILSLPLAQKIHELILTSRRIQSIADGFFDGYLTQEQVARRMEVLEDQYDRLRDSVTGELETAWVRAGFLPAQMPTYPPASKFFQAAPVTHDWYYGKNTTEMTRKRSHQDDGDEGTPSKKTKKTKKVEKKASIEGWVQPTMLEPVGQSKPMKVIEKKRLETWEMGKAWGRGRVKSESEELSPKALTSHFR